MSLSLTKKNIDSWVRREEANQDDRKLDLDYRNALFEGITHLIKLMRAMVIGTKGDGDCLEIHEIDLALEYFIARLETQSTHDHPARLSVVFEPNSTRISVITIVKNGVVIEMNEGTSNTYFWSPDLTIVNGVQTLVDIPGVQFLTGSKFLDAIEIFTWQDTFLPFVEDSEEEVFHETEEGVQEIDDAPLSKLFDPNSVHPLVARNLAGLNIE